MEEQKKIYKANMWGWKWSIISLIIILLSAFMLFVVKPKLDAANDSYNTEIMTEDTLQLENKINN